MAEGAGDTETCHCSSSNTPDTISGGGSGRRLHKCERKRAVQEVSRRGEPGRSPCDGRGNTSPKRGPGASAQLVKNGLDGFRHKDRERDINS